ncbi:unnamed protein product [Rodentolepis nana]|uniref:MFS domain-containing protein n=1 Tax=Rodentolepis nana TaxID=102285 RepID=A0A158QIL2_RODNA|nr:unnamed protein product [Rodentolepis nana]
MDSSSLFPHTKQDNDTEDLNPVPERRRWFMLAIFSVITSLNAYQWMHIGIVMPSTIYFWNGSLPSSKQGQEDAISWLSMIYMLMYIPMVVPGTWVLNRYGLRVALITGAGLNALGACIKCVSMELSQPHGVETVGALSSFPILMLGQCICALAQVFTLGMPAQLAATWFGESEVALATSIGVFSNQIGECLCGEYNVFKERPKTPPSRAQLKRVPQFEMVDTGDAKLSSYSNSDIDNPDVTTEVAVMKRNFFHQVFCCFKNLSFVLLMICYGVNTGVYYEIGTLLSPMVTNFFPDEHITIGWIGFTMIIAGLFGSIVAGIILRNTGQYRRVFVAFYFLSVISWCTFMGSLYSPHISALFFTVSLLGFFQSGFLPLGFEFAAEITYPIDEAITSGLLNTSAQVFGIALTYSSIALLHSFGPLVTNIFALVCLLVTALPACES